MRLGGFPRLLLASLRIALVTAAEKVCDFPTPRERRTPAVFMQLARLSFARLLLWLASLCD
jgi:hypothetical protein